MAIGNIFLSFASFSVRIYQVSDVENRFSTGNYIAFRGITILLAFVIMIPYTLLTTSSISLIPPVLAYLLFKMDEAFCDVLYGIDQKYERMDYIGCSQFMRGVLVVLAFCLGLLIGKSLLTAFAAMFVCCFSMTLLYDLPHSRRFETINVSIQPRCAVDLFKTCLPVMLSATLVGAVVSIARQLFANQFGTTELGYYAAVATPAVLIQAASRYLYAPVLVPMAEKWDSGDTKGFRALFNQTVCLIAAAAAFATFIVVSVSPIIFPLVYGEDITPYTNAALMMGVLMSTNCIAFVNFFIDSLVVCRDIRGSLLAVSTGFLLCLALSNPLEQSLHMHGINAVVITSMLAILLVSFIKINRKSRQTNSERGI